MPTDNKDTKMTYRFLGDSGLLVSKLALGSWVIPNPNQTADAWYEVVKTAYAHGINFFDTAENYDDGNGEVLLGSAIKKGIEDGLWEREDLVISTKLFSGNQGHNFRATGPNGQGLSRKHLIEGIKTSLKKLQLQNVDVLFCHRPDKCTPIEEVVRAMNFIINQGWTFYWGTSEWSPIDIQEACAIADRLGMVRPIVEQPQYNILERSKVEFQYADLIKTRKLGLTVFSPLASGILTGKYNNNTTPEGSRLANPTFRAFPYVGLEQKIAIARQLAPIAAKLDCTMAQLAIAWCVSNENVSTVLLGARNSAQLEETCKALSVVDKLTPEIKAEIDAIVQFKPQLWEPDFLYAIRERFL